MYFHKHYITEVENLLQITTNKIFQMKQSKNSKQSNKGLQKFTDFEALKTKEDYIQLLEEAPEQFDNVAQWVIKRVNEELNSKDPGSAQVDKYYNRFERLVEVKDPESLPEIRRDRWRVNQRKIETELHKFLFNGHRLPTNEELSLKTGLSRVTINKHLKEGAGASIFKEDMEVYRLLTSKAITKLYTLGIKNNDVRALKIFLDYFKDNSPTPPIKTQNNYLQINNTRIDEFTVNLLPDEARLQIETILKQYQTV